MCHTVLHCYRLSDEHASAVDRLVRTSGKMVLLDKLMRRLRETGHRVLVFSQVRDYELHGCTCIGCTCIGCTCTVLSALLLFKC
jgi:hypothetical protein